VWVWGWVCGGAAVVVVAAAVVVVVSEWVGG
jgi:hypothetical protein